MLENKKESSPRQGILARDSAIKTILIESTKCFPVDVIAINIAHDLVTGKCHVVGSTCPVDVATHVRDMAHKCIDDWFTQNGGQIK